MIEKLLFRIILIISLTIPKYDIAQHFINPDFDGSQTSNLSGLPNSWQKIPASDINCLVPTNYSGLGDTPDLTDDSGPMASTGIFGNSYSGLTFISGVRANNFHEGIMQEVNGLIVGTEYTLGFYQSVVKQQNCLDTSGGWTVILDNNVVFNSAVSTSDKAFDDPNLNWEYREFNFIAYASSIDIKFLPYDDDSNLDLQGNELDGALRMGIDLVELNELSYPTYITDTLLCSNTNITVALNYPNASYSWYDNTTGNSNTFNSTGSYQVQVTTPDSIFNQIYNIDYFNIENTTFPKDTTLCSGVEISFYTPQTSNSFFWNNSNPSDSLVINSSGTYTYTQYEDNCFFTDTIEVQYRSFPNLNLNDTAMCEGDKIELNLPHQFVYNWQDGTTDFNYEIENAGFYSLEVSNETCSEFHQFEVSVVDTISFEGFADTTLCFGEELDLSLPQGDFNATWSDNSQNNLEITQTGDYFLNLNNNCSNKTYPFHVEVLPSLEFDLGVDTSLCYSDSLVLTPSSNINQNYTWQDGSVQASFLVTQAGMYTVTSNVQNCKYSDSVMVEYFSPLSLNLIDDSSICSTDDFILEAEIENAEFILWNTGSTTSYLYINESNLYSVEISNTCESLRDSVYIEVVECEEEVNIYAPNTFTPNGDAKNDVFKFISDNNFNRFQWEVFNRWGELVFEGNDIQAIWDGTYLNKTCKDGIYVWKLTYSTSDSAYVEQKTGTINLLR